jgi:hypothetical protein
MEKLFVETCLPNHPQTKLTIEIDCSPMNISLLSKLNSLANQSQVTKNVQTIYKVPLEGFSGFKIQKGHLNDFLSSESFDRISFFTCGGLECLRVVVVDQPDYEYAASPDLSNPLVQQLTQMADESRKVYCEVSKDWLKFIIEQDEFIEDCLTSFKIDIDEVKEMLDSYQQIFENNLKITNDNMLN